MNNLKFGKIFGISLELHYTFLILLIFLIIVFSLFSISNLVGYLILFLFLFMSVFFHELVHSLVSIHLGYRVEKIILLPIGGVSLTKDSPKDSFEELLIAFVGPLFNFFIMGIILLLAFIFPLSLPENLLVFSSIELFEKAVLTYPLYALLYVNAMLGFFNLFVPALPLDGGRILRSLLSFVVGFNKATHISTKVSTILSFFLFIVGFFMGNFLLSIIAIFIYLGALGEDKMVILSENLKGIKVKELVSKEKLLKKNLTIEKAYLEMKKNNCLDLLFFLDKNFFVIDSNLIQKVSRNAWNEVKVLDVGIIVNFLQENSFAIDAFKKLSSNGVRILPVFSKKKFVGVLKESSLMNKFELNLARK